MLCYAEVDVMVAVDDADDHNYGKLHSNLDDDNFVDWKSCDDRC